MKAASVVALLLVYPLSGHGQAAAPEASPPAGDPMSGWTPRKVSAAQEKAARQEIVALVARMERAAREGDLEAAAALVDFPVLMITDTKAGEAVGEPWSAEQWKKEMEPFYTQPAMREVRMKHSPKVFLVSEALASVDDEWTMTLGKEKVSGRSSMLLVRMGGEWKVKAMVEGGWGDAPATGGAAAPPADTR